MSKDLLSSIFELAKKKEYIDDELINYIDEIFTEKAVKVIEVIKRGITKNIFKPSNRIIWTAMGENQVHLIYPKIYCSCQDFYKSVVIKRDRDFCKHILAQIISLALNNYKINETEDTEFDNIIEDLKLKI